MIRELKDMKLETCALLLIDFQKDFCSPGGYGDQCFGLDWVRPILPVAERLLQTARELGITVIHTREGYAPDLSDCPPLRIERSRKAGGEYGSMGPMGRLMIRGEAGNALIDSLAPIEGERAYDKPSYGSFATTSIEQDLRAQGIQQLFVAGVTADVCVHTTLREATDRSFDCYYIRDAISTVDPGIRKACEEMILQEGGIWGQLTDSEQVIALWQQLQKTQAN